MENRTTGIILTVVSVLLCGCPGLVSLCGGVMFALVSFIPDANIDVFGSNDPAAALLYGIGGVCLGIVFIAVSVAVGYLTLGRKRENSFDEPIPPAI